MTTMMQALRALALLLVLAAGCAGSALAQSSFETPGGSRVDGKVDMCLNASGKAVPCSDATAVGVPVTTTPLGVTTTTANSTIAVTNTFQAALAASAARKACLLQNTGSNVQRVYFGTLGSATTSNAFQVNPGQTISCANVNGTVATDAVNITGTAGDGYIVTSQ